jgi:hypothetical protein
MIKEFEFYHGVVFTKLIHQVENISIKVFPTGSNASYVINDAVGLYIKHCTKRMSPWRFSFKKEHQDEILDMKNKLSDVFLILICGDDGIVTINFNDLKKILDETHGEVEWISASRNPKKEYTIKGSDGSLGRKIGKSDFPKVVIESIFTVADKEVFVNE